MSAKEIELNVKDGNVNTIIAYVASIYSHPRDTIEQYVENARDSYVGAGQSGGLITVQLFRKGAHPKVIIRDYGQGMNCDKMKRLPLEITSSEKLQNSLSRGQKAIGMLSFFQFSHKCEIVSKQENESFWHKLIFEKNRETGLFKPAILDEEFETGNRGESGTTITISGIDVEVLNQMTYRKIYDHLQEKFSDDIQNEKIKIQFSEDDKTTSFISPEDISSGIPYPIQDKRTEYGFISFNLFLWPKAAGRRRVGVKSRGGLKILDDITTDSNFENFPWNSEQVFGHISFDCLKTTSAKNSIIPDKHYSIFVKAVKEIEERLAEEVISFQSKEQEKKRREAENMVSQIFKDVLRELKLEENPFKTPTASNGGDEEIAGSKDTIKTLPGGNKHNTRDGDTRPVVPIIDTNDKTHKEHAKYIGLPNIAPQSFEGTNEKLHSFRDEIESTIYYNDTHPDYIKARESDDATRLEYLLLIVAKETVIFENQGETPMKIAEEMIKVMSIVNRKKVQYSKKGS